MVLSQLTADEQSALAAGRWFSQLPPFSRPALLRFASVKQYEDGQQIVAMDRPFAGLLACTSGAFRVCTTTSGGAMLAISYVKPGAWLCTAGVLEGTACAHEAYARGDTTLLSVSAKDFRTLLAEHPEFYDAVLRLYAREIRGLFARIEDLHTLQLRARLGKQLAALARGFGVPCVEGSVKIGLHLSQAELGQLVGASRQCVNRELKLMEQEGVIQQFGDGLKICDRRALETISQG